MSYGGGGYGGGRGGGSNGYDNHSRGGNYSSGYSNGYATYGLDIVVKSNAFPLPRGRDLMRLSVKFADQRHLRSRGSNTPVSAHSL